MSMDRVDDAAMKIKEAAIYKLARVFTESKQFSEVVKLLKDNNDFFGGIPKARTAKIVRSIIDIVATIPDSLDIQITLCKEVVEWCKLEKRTFLRQRIEAKLAAFLLRQKDINGALSLVNGLLTELKKLDDKQMLTETHLTEARIYLALENIPKSKAALTSSRSAATAIYVVPILQAEMDELSGMLQVEEEDYTTSYSYFLEAFEAFDQADVKESAVRCLTYMCLSKILGGNAVDVPNIVTGKHGLKYGGIHLECMSALAKAAKSRSLELFQEVVQKFNTVLTTDDLIARRIDILYNSMLESNLVKIIAPFSRIEISHIAHLIKLPGAEVEKKLAHMILDHKFSGILDQGQGTLIVYDSPQEDPNFNRGLDIINNMGNVVDVLQGRGQRLHQYSAKMKGEQDAKAKEDLKENASRPSSPKSKSKTPEKDGKN